MLSFGIDNHRHRCCTALIFGPPAGRNSRLTQRETYHYIARYASALAWPYLAGSSPGQLSIELFTQHQRFAVCCQLKNCSAVEPRNSAHFCNRELVRYCRVLSLFDEI